MLELNLHESHDMVETPINTYECRKCWYCTCHKLNELQAECTESRVL